MALNRPIVFFINCNLQNLSQILLKFTRFSTGNIDWTRLWVTDGIRIWLHTCEGLWACLVTTRPSGSRSRWSWRIILSLEVLTPILQLKSLQIRWESCEFKSVTGSLVTLVLKLKTAWIWVRFVRDFGNHKSWKKLKAARVVDSRQWSRARPRRPLKARFPSRSL